MNGFTKQTKAMTEQLNLIGKDYDHKSNGLPMRRVATREELIALERKRIEDYKNGLYAVYLMDPDRYIEDCKGNTEHIDFITKEFPKRLAWTDEQCYEEAVALYRDSIDAGVTCYEIREDGSLWETADGHAQRD